jgi:hypothetical protein
MMMMRFAVLFINRRTEVLGKVMELHVESLTSYFFSPALTSYFAVLHHPRAAQNCIPDLDMCATSLSHSREHAHFIPRHKSATAGRPASHIHLADLHVATTCLVQPHP